MPRGTIPFHEHPLEHVASPSHLIKRVEWANKYCVWNAQEWSKVMFSDDKKFNLDDPDGFAYYWRDIRRDERYFSKRQCGDGGVMVWAAITPRATSPLVRVQGT